MKNTTLYECIRAAADKNLSLRAKGLMLHLLDYPGHVEITKEDIEKDATEFLEALYELIEKKYYKN